MEWRRWTTYQPGSPPFPAWHTARNSLGRSISLLVLQIRKRSEPNHGAQNLRPLEAGHQPINRFAARNRQFPFLDQPTGPAAGHDMLVDDTGGRLQASCFAIPFNDRAGSVIVGVVPPARA